jgi:hypothetical protein
MVRGWCGHFNSWNVPVVDMIWHAAGVFPCSWVPVYCTLNSSIHSIHLADFIFVFVHSKSIKVTLWD